MSPFDLFISKIDPTQASFSALVWFVLGAAWFFLWRKVWPWYTGQYYPAKLELERARLAMEASHERENIEALRMVRDALVEIKVVVGQQLIMIQQHDTTARAGIENMTHLQAVTLEKLGVPVPRAPLSMVKADGLAAGSQESR